MLCYTRYILRDNGDAKRNIMYSQSAYFFLAIYFSLFTNPQQLKRIISQALSFLTVLIDDTIICSSLCQQSRKLSRHEWQHQLDILYLQKQAAVEEDWRL